MDELSPARILDVGMGFWPAKTLLSAAELGLFTRLGSGSMTGEELRAALGLHSRAVPDFFDLALIVCESRSTHQGKC